MSICKVYIDAENHGLERLLSEQIRACRTSEVSPELLTFGNVDENEKHLPTTELCRQLDIFVLSTDLEF
jgi:hypothetical protein